jgi:hypothetical protein
VAERRRVRSLRPFDSRVVIACVIKWNTKYVFVRSPEITDLGNLSPGNVTLSSGARIAVLPNY